MYFHFAEVRLNSTMAPSSRLLMLGIYVLALATAAVHSSQCTDSGSHTVVLDQPITVLVSSNSTVHIPVRYDAVTLLSVYSLLIEARSDLPESVFWGSEVYVLVKQ